MILAAPTQEASTATRGFSTRGHYGMFSIYFRGEFQHAPSWEGYSLPLSETLARIDDFATFSSVPLDGNTTIPLGPVSSVNNLTVLEGYVSAHVVGHEISFGKMDNWYGPGMGGGMAWSNNAENIWSFRIDRVEPLIYPVRLTHRRADPIRLLRGTAEGPQRSR